MKILICGAAGFIGSHLAEKMISLGFEVWGCDNLSTGRMENLESIINNPAFHFEYQDICQWNGPSAEVDLVYQFASPASPVYYMSMPINTYLSNSIGNYNMLQYAKKCNARFVFASTSEIYGDPQINPQEESYYGYVNSVGERSCYDESKRFGEGMTVLYNKLYCMDTRVARIFNVYGNRMRKDDYRVIPNFITQCLAGKPITIYGDGMQTRSFCYIDDFIEAIVKFGMLDGLNGSVINIGNPEEVSILDLMHLIKKMCNSNSEVKYYDKKSDDPGRRKPNIERAKKLLNWYPQTSLEEGIACCVREFAKQ